MAEVLQPQERSTLSQHLRRLGPFELKLLTSALVLALVGFGVYVMAEFNRPAPVAKGVTPSMSTPANGFVNDSSTGQAAPPADEGPPALTWTGWGGSKGMTLGFGFVGGFIIGFIFRAFLKIMTLITVVIGGGLLALSHFHILNIDFTAAHKIYADNSEWITDQALRLKDVLVAHLPSSTTGAAGVFFGARRR